ncbi:MAG: YciI family protein [Archangium sp.]|nr:YciI family protein [Archangium sp.]
MHFMLLFNSPLSDLERKRDDPDSTAHWEAWRAYITALNDAGVVRRGDALTPPTMATTVRVREGRRQIHDGPFADTKEMLGGYVVIDVASLDEALEWAARSPSSRLGSTEIRPVDGVGAGQRVG